MTTSIRFLIRTGTPSYGSLLYQDWPEKSMIFVKIIPRMKFFRYGNLLDYFGDVYYDKNGNLGRAPEGGGQFTEV